MTPYQRQKQTRRTALSFGAAFLLHLLIAGGALLYDHLFVEDIGEFSGPVLVKLGEPEGEDLPLLPEEAEQPGPEEASPDSPVISDPPEPASLETPPPSTAEPVTAEKPVEQLPVEPPRESLENQDDESPAETSGERSTDPPGEPEFREVSGEEGGNSWESRYDSDGRVGRSLGAEIYLYMPLPSALEIELLDRVQGESYSTGTSRRDFILRYYDEFNGELVLMREPLRDDVRAIWDYLIDAGYDYENAEYKSGGYLRPVVLSFTISPDGELLNVKVQKSSGISEVDQAVLAGFESASFYNSVEREVNGRFTYRFH